LYRSQYTPGAKTAQHIGLDMNRDYILKLKHYSFDILEVD
jgi:hypothetical protein